MEEKRSWLQENRVAIGVGAMVLVIYIAIVLFIVIGYSFEWTGFNGYNNITVAHTISGTNAGTVIRTEEYQPGKTLWDWLNLFLLSVVTILAALLTNLYSNRQKETELAIASEKQRKDDLQAYIDKISELLLEKHLRESKPDDEVRKIARVRTIAVLRGLDPKRKGSVLQFLYESGLIDKDKTIIDLNQADLRNIDLQATNLSGANLQGAFLQNANLFAVDLTNANLQGSILDKANLFGAKLISSNLRKAYLCDAILVSTDLREADLREANLSRAKLKNTTLKGAKLEGAIFFGVDTSECDLNQAELSVTNGNAVIIP